MASSWCLDVHPSHARSFWWAKFHADFLLPNYQSKFEGSDMYSCWYTIQEIPDDLVHFGLCKMTSIQWVHRVLTVWDPTLRRSLGQPCTLNFRTCRKNCRFLCIFPLPRNGCATIGKDAPLNKRELGQFWIQEWMALSSTPILRIQPSHRIQPLPHSLPSSIAPFNISEADLRLQGSCGGESTPSVGGSGNADSHWVCATGHGGSFAAWSAPPCMLQFAVVSSGFELFWISVDYPSLTKRMNTEHVPRNPSLDPPNTLAQKGLHVPFLQGKKASTSRNWPLDPQPQSMYNCSSRSFVACVSHLQLPADGWSSMSQLQQSAPLHTEWITNNLSNCRCQQFGPFGAPHPPCSVWGRKLTCAILMEDLSWHWAPQLKICTDVHLMGEVARQKSDLKAYFRMFLQILSDFQMTVEKFKGLGVADLCRQLQQPADCGRKSGPRSFLQKPGGGGGPFSFCLVALSYESLSLLKILTLSLDGLLHTKYEVVPQSKHFLVFLNHHPLLLNSPPPPFQRGASTSMRKVCWTPVGSCYFQGDGKGCGAKGCTSWNVTSVCEISQHVIGSWRHLATAGILGGFRARMGKYHKSQATKSSVHTFI